MAEFKQVIEWLKEGKKVRRHLWTRHHIILNYHSIEFYDNEDNHHYKDSKFILGDYSATDWEIYEEPQVLKESKPEFTENQLATIGQIQKLLQGFGCNTEVKLEGKCPFAIGDSTCIHKYSKGCLHLRLYNILKKHKVI